MKNFFFNFLWLIWDNYLPLDPTQNDWSNQPPWPTPGGTPILSTVHKTKYTFFHSDFNYFHIYGGKWGIMKHILSWRHLAAIKAKKLAKKRPKFLETENFNFFSLDCWKKWLRDYFSLLTFFPTCFLKFWPSGPKKAKNPKSKIEENFNNKK